MVVKPILAAFVLAGCSRAQSPESYEAALEAWSSPEDITAYVGERFTYDSRRAAALTEDANGPRPAIKPPPVFYNDPSGVCVDLARFGYETMQAVAPQLEPRYLMIEFEPTEFAGATFRRHWLVTFRRDGGVYIFADSKRPNHIAGPYSSVDAFVAEYAEYRDREVVTFKERDTYRRKKKKKQKQKKRFLVP